MNISVHEEDLHHLKNLMETIKRGDYEFYPEVLALQTIIFQCEYADEPTKPADVSVCARCGAALAETSGVMCSAACSFKAHTA